MLAPAADTPGGSGPGAPVQLGHVRELELLPPREVGMTVGQRADPPQDQPVDRLCGVVGPGSLVDVGGGAEPALGRLVDGRAHRGRAGYRPPQPYVCGSSAGSHLGATSVTKRTPSPS